MNINSPEFKPKGTEAAIGSVKIKDVMEDHSDSDYEA